MKAVLKLCGILVIVAIIFGIVSLWFSTVIVGNLWINGPAMAMASTILTIVLICILVWAIIKIIKL